MPRSWCANPPARWQTTSILSIPAGEAFYVDGIRALAMPIYSQVAVVDAATGQLRLGNGDVHLYR